MNAGAAGSAVLEMSVNQAHQRLGHPIEQTTRATAAELGWKLTRGSMKPCENCAKGKVKQKNMPKDSHGEKPAAPNDLWFHDIATVKPSDKNDTVVSVTKPQWQIIVDGYSGLKMSTFNAKKGDITESTCERMYKQASR